MRPPTEAFMTSNSVLSVRKASAVAAGQVLGSCFSCMGAVTVEDDCARMRDRLYHLGCMLHAIRRCGDDALRGGIEVIESGQGSGRSAVPSPAATGRTAE